MALEKNTIEMVSAGMVGRTRFADHREEKQVVIMAPFNENSLKLPWERLNLRGMWSI